MSLIVSRTACSSCGLHIMTNVFAGPGQSCNSARVGWAGGDKVTTMVVTMKIQVVQVRNQSWKDVAHVLIASIEVPVPNHERRSLEVGQIVWLRAS